MEEMGYAGTDLSLEDVLASDSSLRYDYAFLCMEEVGFHEQRAEELAERAVHYSDQNDTSMTDAVVEILCDAITYVMGLTLCFLLILILAVAISSIFNLVRDEDFFTRIPLAGWGYTKYGRTISLSDCADIGKRYRILTGEEYIGFSDGKAAEGFLCAAMRLAPNIHAYYERKYPVGGHELALYDYMLTVAQLLADEADESTGDIMMGAMVSDFADLSDFLMSGMDIGALLSPAQGIPRCSVADSHSPAAYMAALDMVLAQKPAVLADAGYRDRAFVRDDAELADQSAIGIRQWILRDEVIAASDLV